MFADGRLAALIFCRGMTSTSRACQTSTAAGSSSVVASRFASSLRGLVLRAASRSTRAIPRNTMRPSSDHDGLRKPTVRMPAGKRCDPRPARRRGGRGAAALSPRPGDDGMRRAVAARRSFAAQAREVVGVLAPGEPDVDRRGGIEHAERAGRRDRRAARRCRSSRRPSIANGEQPALVLPRELGDVAERHVAAGRQLADDERRAGRRRSSSAGRGPGCAAGATGVPFSRAVALDRQVRPGGIERERLDAVDRRRRVGLISPSSASGCRACDGPVSSACAASLPAPRSSRSHRRSISSRPRTAGCEPNGASCRAIGDARDAELVVTVGAVDAVGEPAAVGRQSAAGEPQAFPTARSRRRQGPVWIGPPAATGKGCGEHCAKIEQAPSE